MKKRLPLLLATAALGACSFAPDPAVPPSVASLPEEFRASESTGTYAGLGWWRVFGDPTLDALVDSAAVSNLDLAEAVARVEQVRAQAGIAWADLLPSVQAGADVSRSSQPANTGIGGAVRGTDGDASSALPSVDRFDFTTYSASLGFSWELDFWGRARNDQRAAAAELMASRADLHAARLGVLSETISTYFQLVQLRRQARLTEEITDVLSEREEITETRYDRGLVSSLELYQVRLDRRTVQAGLPEFQGQIADAEGRLAVLVGRYAGTVADLLEEAPGPRPVRTPIASGIPADVLLQRPDVRAAAERLEAARYRVGARRAELLPSVNLSGTVGQQSGDAAGVFEAGQWFTNLMAGVTAPIFQAGRLRNSVKAAEAQHAQAAAAFGRSVLTAVSEVETALRTHDAERERYAFFESQLEEARAAADLTARRYAAGVTGYIDYLDALRQLFGVESSLHGAATQLALARLGVHRALGGGWTDLEPTTVVDVASTDADVASTEVNLPSTTDVDFPSTGAVSESIAR